MARKIVEDTIIHISNQQYENVYQNKKKIQPLIDKIGSWVHGVLEYWDLEYIEVLLILFCAKMELTLNNFN